MAQPQKKLVMFVADKPKESSYGLAFYGFTEDNSIDEQEFCGCPIQVTDPSQICNPLFVQDHCHSDQSYADLRGRVFYTAISRFDCQLCSSLGKAMYLSNSVYCWDPNRTHWRRSVPKMNLARHRCELHVINDTLYVTGYPARTEDGETIIMERLDDSVGRWTMLRDCPPRHVKLNLTNFVCAAVKSRGYILFGSNACEYFYAFTPPNTWVLMDHLRFERDKLYGHAMYSKTVTEDYMLWLSGQNGLLMLGFDLNDGRYFQIDLKSEGVLRRDGSEYQFPYLVYVGEGVLGIVWSDVMCIQLDGTRCYHCSKFSIYFDADGKPRVKRLSVMSGVGLGDDQVMLHAFVVDLEVSVGKPTTSSSKSILAQKRKLNPTS